MRRTQIYLDDAQYGELAVLAERRGVTTSSLIREAINGYLATQLSPAEKLQRLRELGARFSGRAASEKMPGVDTAEIVDSIRAADAARLQSQP